MSARAGAAGAAAALGRSRPTRPPHPVAPLRLAPIALVLLAVGCARWPPVGSGGMAELRPLANPPCSRCPGPPDPTWRELDTQARLAHGHLDNLVLRGAELCLPGQVAVARERQTRIEREIDGGLPLDAADDLIVQRDKLAELERRLDYVQASGACLTPAMLGRAPAWRE